MTILQTSSSMRFRRRRPCVAASAVRYRSRYRHLWRIPGEGQCEGQRQWWEFYHLWLLSLYNYILNVNNFAHIVNEA